MLVWRKYGVHCASTCHLCGCSTSRAHTCQRSGATHRVSASRLCGAVAVVYTAPAQGAEYILRGGRGASDDGVVHRKDAARFIGADDEVRGERSQRRFKKDFAPGAVVH